MHKTLSFSRPEKTKQGNQGIEYSFPFSVIDSSLIGKSEETAATSHYEVVVPIADVLLLIWRLNEADLERVLFEFGKRHVVELVKTHSLPAEKAIEMQTLASWNSPNQCPFDPARIEKPDGARVVVELESPKIGFKP